MIGAFQAAILGGSAKTPALPANPYISWDSVSGTTLVDSVGGRNATITGATYTDGILAFDGVNDYAKTATLPWPFNIMTISMQVKIYSVATGTYKIIMEQGAGTTPPHSAFFYGYQNNSFFDYYLMNATGNKYYRATTYPAKGVFANIILEFNKPLETITLWVNGALAAHTLQADTTAASTANFSDYVMNIGSRNGTSFFCKMDLKMKTRIYGRALTADERAQLAAEV